MSALKEGGKTLPMTVANTGFMLDRLGQDCAPLQFLRELTQNSIEAILRKPDPSGQIIWDVDWPEFDLSNGERIKLCLIDNGVGMTAEEQVRYVNQLSSSVHQQSHDGNFGVGAKIAAATRNHEGLIYLSWREGKGSMIQLWRDPETGEYGLKQHEVGPGSFMHVATIEDTVKPKEIGDSGTKVILLGNEPYQNTMLPPPGARTPSKWIVRYLNTRYFKIPEGIQIRVREGWENPRTDKDRNLLRRVIGQAAYLESHSEASGVLDLVDARAHWWILKDDSSLTSHSGVSASSGHVAALFSNELYDVKEANAGYARLQLFGVYFAYNRVVIYLEPLPSGDVKILANTARTDLLMNNEPLPWTEWAAEFRDRMPEPIRVLMESVAHNANQSNHRDAIKERLKRIKDLLKLSRYRRTEGGTLSLDESSVVAGGKTKDGGSPPQRRESEKSPGGVGGRGGSIYSLFLKPDSIPGEEIRSDNLPEVIWVSVKNKTRGPGMLEDRAARFIVELNQIQANSDFRVFQDLIEYWQKQYPDVPGSALTIEQVVKEWFEQSLVEAVLGALSLKDSPQWTFEDLSGAWSEEALTTAVMLRYHVNESVKRVLGQRLGSLREKSA